MIRLKLVLILGGISLLISLLLLVRWQIKDNETRLERENEQINQIRQENIKRENDLEREIKTATQSASYRSSRSINPISLSKYSISIESIKARIKQLFGSHSAEAEAIIICESGFNISAYNPSSGGNWGLFQINSVHTLRFGSSFRYDPMQNIFVAYQIYKEQGNWSAWTCSKKVGLS